MFLTSYLNIFLTIFTDKINLNSHELMTEIYCSHHVLYTTHGLNSELKVSETGASVEIVSRTFVVKL